MGEAGIVCAVLTGPDGAAELAVVVLPPLDRAGRGCPEEEQPVVSSAARPTATGFTAALLRPAAIRQTGTAGRSTFGLPDEPGIGSRDRENHLIGEPVSVPDAPYLLAGPLRRPDGASAVTPLRIEEAPVIWAHRRPHLGAELRAWSLAPR